MRLPIAISMGLVNVGCLLIGWGEVGSYWNDVPRATVAAVLLIAPVVVLAVAPNAGGGAAEHIVRQRVRILGSISVILPVLYGAVAALDRREVLLRPDVPWVRWAGLSLAFIGGAVTLWSLVCLGRQYSIYITRQENHELVRTGLYRHIRHPIYLGFLVWTFGFVFVFRSWGGLAVWLVILASMIGKLRREEVFLHAQFPREYGDYASRTWRLVPFVY